MSAAWSYDYERIRDLTHRIGDCQRRIGQQLSEGREGGVRALGLAGQIVADAQELRALLQVRNEANDAAKDGFAVEREGRFW